MRLTQLSISKKQWIQLLLLATCLLVVALANHSIPARKIHWLFIVERLYYLPIIGSGLAFGWRAGLLMAVGGGASLLLLDTEPSTDYDLLDRYLDVLMFLVVGFMTGVLANRERRSKQALQRASERVETLYRQLQQNFERMKRADRLSALGHLSAGLAHEIRNPLASIDGAAEILQRNPDNEARRREFLEIIRKESRRLDKLLGNFLSFARPRPPHLQSYEIDPIVDSIINLATPITRGTNVQLKKDVQSGLPPVACDAEQVKQVLLNLTLNAIQAMPGGGTVVLSARCEDDRLVIRVSDEGRGVKPELADNIFDPFFTTKENGTGLGLSVAYQIAEQHGGALQLDRNSESGATFAMILPLSRGN